MQKQVSYKIVSLVFGVLVICFAVGFYALAVWTEPTAVPPGDNVDKPINVGGITQIKSGALGIEGVFQASGGSGSPVLNVIGGNVGIGTTIPNSLLRVEGDVAGAKFKDTSNFSYYVDPGNSGTAATFNGKVGIGTTSPRPNAILHINSKAGEPSIIRLSSPADHDSTIQLYKAPAETGWAIVYDGQNGTGNFRINRDEAENTGTHTYLEINKDNGKVSMPGGVDPPFVSFSNESHESIRKFAKDVVPHEKVMQFWNEEAHRFEVYVIDEDSFYTFAGELIEE